MKKIIVTLLNVILVFIPWSILYLRTFSWALISPTAKIIICCYAAFMVMSAIVSLLSYFVFKVKNIFMKILLFINCLYGGFGLFILWSNLNF